MPSSDEKSAGGLFLCLTSIPLLDHQYPTVYCHYAHLYFDLTQTPRWLEEQIAAGMEPCLLVGIPVGDADAERDRYRFVARELVPAVEREFAAAPHRADRWLLGYSAGAGHMVELGMPR